VGGRFVAAQPQVKPDKEFRLADDECRFLVNRILASPEFQRAARLRAFLNYVVERKLAGSPEDVTEILIGHRVFRRPATYNPGEDSIVRTEARTLRQRLERYFAADGADEPVILEIPRGGYLPVFRPRSETKPPAVSELPLPTTLPGTLRPGLSRRQWIALGASAAIVPGAGLWVWNKRRVTTLTEAGFTAARPASIRLESSDQRLTLAFQRARERALACVFTADPVGDWYASNRDNRAFCMRDTAHESIGAAMLGLYPHTLNMLRRFAASIAKSRGWCGYWIITKDGFPSPLEFAGDDSFSYALPANFDLVRACHRQLLWTGDRQYLDPVFTGFYDRTVSQYVQEWDRERDGAMKARDDRPRVSASYNQQAPHFLTGADLIAAQYGGYLSYAAIQEIKGGRGSLSHRFAAEFRAKADVMRNRFNTEWWDPAKDQFRSGMMRDHSWCTDYVAPCNVYPLKFGIPEDGPKTEASLDLMEHHRPPYDSTYSYYPEVLYRYGRNDSAYRYLLEISDPAFSGYAMTETAFAAIGAIGAGLMGIDPDAPQSSVATMPRLPAGTEWVRMANVPVAANQIAVEHRGNAETHFTNQAGDALTWKVAFPLPASGSSAGIVIDRTAAPKLTIEHRANRQPVICATAPVQAGQTRVAKLVV
jgi:hypothetical protein